MLEMSTATVNWTRMIDFDFSAVVRPICWQTSAEVKSRIHKTVAVERGKCQMVCHIPDLQAGARNPLDPRPNTRNPGIKRPYFLAVK